MQFIIERLYKIESRADQLAAINRDCSNRVREARAEVLRLEGQLRDAERHLAGNVLTRRNGGRVSLGLLRAIDAAKAKLAFVQAEQQAAGTRSQAAVRLRNECKKYLEQNGGIGESYSPITVDKTAVHSRNHDGTKRVRMEYI